MQKLKTILTIKKMKMDIKKILLTAAISAATSILLDFVLPYKVEGQSGSVPLTRINFSK